MRNIELKAHLSSLEDATDICSAIDARFAGDLYQLDTYFGCSNGRLKLREVEPGDDYLVHYSRANVAGSKACEYIIQYVDVEIKTLLKNAYGITIVVDKVRGLWLWENVRIHLDRVENLGTFIEFEAVLSKEFDDTDGFKKLAFLQKTFGIENDDVLDVSYADLMAGKMND